MVIVDIALATVCFLGECHPALVGRETPKGTFEVVQRMTSDPGYGGDVLQFHEDEKAVFAIHRTWTLNPRERRDQRLRSQNPKDRLITNGCVNVDPVIYARLVECCANSTLVIK